MLRKSLRAISRRRGGLRQLDHRAEADSGADGRRASRGREADVLGAAYQGKEHPQLWCPASATIATAGRGTPRDTRAAARSRGAARPAGRAVPCRRRSRAPAPWRCGRPARVRKRRKRCVLRPGSASRAHRGRRARCGSGRRPRLPLPAPARELRGAGGVHEHRTRRPSAVSAGRLAVGVSARARARVRSTAARGRRAARRRVEDHLPSSPSTTIGAPSADAEQVRPACTVIGMPSERATIAACAVTPPPESAMPAQPLAVLRHVGGAEILRDQDEGRAVRRSARRRRRRSARRAGRASERRRLAPRAAGRAAPRARGVRSARLEDRRRRRQAALRSRPRPPPSSDGSGPSARRSRRSRRRRASLSRSCAATPRARGRRSQGGAARARPRPAPPRRADHRAGPRRAGRAPARARPRARATPASAAQDALAHQPSARRPLERAHDQRGRGGARDPGGRSSARRGTRRGPCAPVAAPSPWPCLGGLGGRGERRFERLARVERGARRRLQGRARRPSSCRPAGRRRARRLRRAARERTTSVCAVELLGVAERTPARRNAVPHSGPLAPPRWTPASCPPRSGASRAGATRPARPAPCRPRRSRGPCSRRGRRRRSRRPAGSGSRADP